MLSQLPTKQLCEPLSATNGAYDASESQTGQVLQGEDTLAVAHDVVEDIRVSDASTSIPETGVPADDPAQNDSKRQVLEGVRFIAQGSTAGDRLQAIGIGNGPMICIGRISSGRNSLQIVGNISDKELMEMIQAWRRLRSSQAD